MLIRPTQSSHLLQTWGYTHWHQWGPPKPGSPSRGNKHACHTTNWNTNRRAADNELPTAEGADVVNGNCIIVVEVLEENFSDIFLETMSLVCWHWSSMSHHDKGKKCSHLQTPLSLSYSYSSYLKSAPLIIWILGHEGMPGRIKKYNDGYKKTPLNSIPSQIHDPYCNSNNYDTRKGLWTIKNTDICCWNSDSIKAMLYTAVL